VKPADVIDDIVVPGLKVVFCGMAAGPKSAREQTPYVGPNNKFWPTLKQIGLIPADFRPQDFRRLPGYGIGLTDVAKTQWGADSKIVVTQHDVTRLRATLRRCKPRLVAFVGKTVASHFFACGTKDLPLGRQPEPWEDTPVFVLCSTSARAHSHWQPACWQALAELVRSASHV
jgi:double-stranded uracil-DNA glycosylase